MAITKGDPVYASDDGKNWQQGAYLYERDGWHYVRCVLMCGEGAIPFRYVSATKPVK